MIGFWCVEDTGSLSKTKSHLKRKNQNKTPKSQTGKIDSIKGRRQALWDLGFHFFGF
jgi:hypothetical protein